MIVPSRGLVARVARPQWRLASTVSRAPRAASKPGPAKVVPKITRPYKPKPPPASTPPPPPPPQAETILDLWRATWLPLSGAAILAGALGFYVVGTVTASLKSPPCSGPCEHSTPTGRPPALTGENAEQFDKELNMPEWWMGITKLRERLSERATGHVLELAMGTGRNLEYYNWEPLNQRVGREKAVTATKGIASFTGLDISVDMLDVARKRLVKTVPPMASSEPIVRASNMVDHTGGQLSFLDDQLRLIHSDAHRPLPPPATSSNSPSPAKYDTIIQTFGLCSVADPVAVLTNLASAVKPGSGRIILLEHGKGWYGIVNGLLDKNAAKHFEKYGCWWNRDIQNLVEEAARKNPGLEVIKVERPNILQMGTLVWVELRVVDKSPSKSDS
ncbi:S-adenosyl-L-methionine-dependent methyltransferase [Dactylonectria macrodidyma]|uniref:S-adenosyl-L-methionine-dependent methyltransferase n=1 Tax=Dactylonectria macrodidyma TaxID=307937 RepID=A0A9P9FTI5_9HYPO|nr:S-adenosyl-L-methionine-dependent methyltransferase [Dactylonectria macrodidyma]